VIAASKLEASPESRDEVHRTDVQLTAQTQQILSYLKTWLPHNYLLTNMYIANPLL